MRIVVAGLVALALGAGAAVAPPVALAQDTPAPAVAEDPAAAVADALASVTAYTSAWPATERDIASLTDFLLALGDAGQQYRAWQEVLQPASEQAEGLEQALTAQAARLRADEAATAAELETERARQAAQERTVGALVRLLYQQPSPELHALEQILDGQDLRSLQRQNLVTDVLASADAELERIVSSVEDLERQLADTRERIARTSGALGEASQRRADLAGALSLIAEALVAIEQDRGAAQSEIDRIRAEEAERIRAQAEAAAAAAAAAAEAAERAAAALSRAAEPTGGGAPAAGVGEFSGRLPEGIPYRDVFLTYGLRYWVEPALLAAIASQESGFNPWAGCDRVGAGKGIMQHENQPAYCGPDAVPASVEKAAIMLASYYNRSGSWTAAVFAYNNGPGLMDEWVRYADSKDELLRVLADYYNDQPYARPGPVRGYPTWGDWRARVAYNYAAPRPDPGFHSATEKWLIYRQG